MNFLPRCRGGDPGKCTRSKKKTGKISTFVDSGHTSNDVTRRSHSILGGGNQVYGTKIPKIY